MHPTWILSLCASLAPHTDPALEGARPGESWRQFRGNSGQGLASTSSVPLSWSEEENITWKSPVPGEGWSSPVVDGEQVWLTYALRDERELRALCLSTETGEVVHDVLILEPDELVPLHERNGHATPTPALDDELVVVSFGTYGTAAVERSSGEVQWVNRELTLIHQWGPASSPVIHEDRVLLNCDGMEDRYVAALDLESGELLWRTERSAPTRDDGFFRKAFSTPIVIEDGRRSLMVSVGANQLGAYDVSDGEEVWFVRFNGYASVAAPAYADGVIYAGTGYGDQSLFAVRMGGEGDVTSSDVLWSTRRGAPIIPSPVVVGAELYMVDDNGVLSCLDASTGEVHWRERLDGGAVSASITYAGGHLFLHNHEGDTFVLEPDAEGARLVGTNSIDGGIQSSLAVAEGALYLRSDAALYRIDD